MRLAPIWSMNPTLQTSLYQPPLRFLSPDCSGLMDERSQVFGGRYYYRGQPLDAETRLGGLWFESASDAYSADRLEQELIKRKAFGLNGFVFLTPQGAEIFAELDLGVGQLSEIPIFREDMSTVYSFSAYLLEFPNHKDTVDREATPKIRTVFPNNPGSGYLLPQLLNENDVFVHQSAVGGPDLWFDPAIQQVQFCSDACAKALAKAGLKSQFDLNQCRFADA